jgi:acetoacetyl-CoA synthetase
MSEIPLWSPSPAAIAASPMTAFMKAAAQAGGGEIGDYEGLHRWSVEDRETFWSLVWDQ